MGSESQERPEYHVDEREIRGHTVRIVERPDRTDLIVDDRQWRYFETPDGFTLQRDAYRGPFKTLAEAVEQYFDFYQPEKEEESGR